MLGSRWKDVRFKMEGCQVQGGEKPGSRWREARFKVEGCQVQDCGTLGLEGCQVRDGLMLGSTSHP